ncbi:unnamed protein product [Sphenostylis stenocarpa]|uniref:Uncharacterized protein n=1 Tax=Sphenostylis stenocarpa TaxID=92480 RepID=A0AA86VGU0_9FABA|nr:unnamed protein product [Sphenostylis stenocarpa]
MASFSVEEFIENGILKGLLQKLLEEGWDDVPTLKIMSSEEMDLLHMTQQQKDQSLLTHLESGPTCSLMQYADKMEDCGKNPSELINLSTTDLSTQFETKSCHTARFVNRRISDDSFKLHALAARRKSSIMMHRDDSIPKSFGSNSSNSLTRSHIRSNAAFDALEQSMAEMKIKEGYVFKGIVAAEPAESRAYHFLQDSDTDLVGDESKGFGDISRKFTLLSNMSITVSMTHIRN